MIFGQRLFHCVSLDVVIVSQLSNKHYKNTEELTWASQGRASIAWGRVALGAAHTAATPFTGTRGSTNGELNCKQAIDSYIYGLTHWPLEDWNKILDK